MKSANGMAQIDCQRDRRHPMHFSIQNASLLQGKKGLANSKYVGLLYNCKIHTIINMNMNRIPNNSYNDHV